MARTKHLERRSALATAITTALGVIALTFATPAIAVDGDPPAASAPAPDDAAVRARYDRIHDDLEASGHRCIILSKAGRAKAVAAMHAFTKDARFLQIAPDQPIRITLPEDYFNPQGQTVSVDSVDFAVNRTDLNKPYISMTRTAKGLKLRPKFVVTFSPTLTVCSESFSVELPNGYRTEDSSETPDPIPTH